MQLGSCLKRKTSLQSFRYANMSLTCMTVCIIFWNSKFANLDLRKEKNILQTLEKSNLPSSLQKNGLG